MNTLTTAIVAWFFAFAGLDSTTLCLTDDAAQACPAGAPPPDASTNGSGKTVAPAFAPAGKPAARPTKDDGIYNGI